MKLTNNNGFKWYSEDNLYVKGYFFLNGQFYKDEETLICFKEVPNYKSFTSLVSQLNGCFSVVMKKNGSIFGAVDRVRSFPIFFDRTFLEISDSVDELNKNLNNTDKDFDKTAICELISSGYVQNDNTLYSNIGQILAGQTFLIEKGAIKTDYYFKHLHNNINETNYEELLKRLNKVSSDIFDRLIESLNGRTAILPLSGGYDSRFIAAMLKKKGYEKVICYTYGQRGSYEVETSEKVAKSLGFEWHCIEYDKSIWSQIFSQQCMDYATFSHNYTTMPHFQDYPALNSLKKMGILPEDGVVVTGFCGDLPAGSFVLSEEDERQLKYDKNWISEFIYNEHYSFKKIPDKYNVEIIKRIKNHLIELGQDTLDFESFTSVYEAWFTNSRPVKWVINSNRIYEFFGFEWRMPLWDNEFIDFFYSVHHNYRRGCKLYQDFLFTNLFNDYGIDFKKPKIINKKPLHYRKTLKGRIRRLLFNNLVRIAFMTGWSSWNYFDVNNYSKAAILLYKNLKNKWLFDKKNINFHQMNALWWSERICGASVIKDIFKTK